MTESPARSPGGVTDRAATSDPIASRHRGGASTREETALAVADRWFARYPAIALAVVLPLGALTPLLPVEVGVATFALGTLVVGMAHGAVDHLVPLRASDASLRRSIAVVSVVYAVLGGGVVVAFFTAPVVAFVGFIALTWLHWGQGDVAALVVAGVEHLQTPATRVLTLVVRGGLPMGVPLLAHPSEYRVVTEWVIGLFVADAAAAVDPLFVPATRIAVGASMAGATLVSVGLGYRQVRAGASRRGWLRDVGETATLWAWFLLAAPVFAVGVYFAAWHALRHVGRLALVDGAATAALADGDVRGALRRFARDAAPLTLGGFLVVGGVAIAVPSGVAAPGDVLGVSLVAIAAMTLPHVAVVAWLDGRQRVWQSMR